MRIIILFGFIFFVSFLNGQNIQKMQFDLTVGQREPFVEKISKARKLISLDPFNVVAADYICRYYEANGIDSISIFFDNLIKKHPSKTEPYLLRSRLLYFEHDSYDKDNYKPILVKTLNSALTINKTDERVLYKLADIYYNDFIYPLEVHEKIDYKEVFGYDDKDDFFDSLFASQDTIIKKSIFEHPADSALKYFYSLWDINKKREIIYYPIKQIECYLKKEENKLLPKNAEKSFDKCFFPSSYFANLKMDWQCDFTVNLLEKINSSTDNAEWLTVKFHKVVYENLVY